jgi:RHS repeat-associated protein
MGLSDSAGTVVATYKYDPFGKLLESSGPTANVNPFRFSTKYYDEDTALYYFGYRYYSPELQRWMGRDPIEESGGFNLYAFVGNDPVNGVDPTGLAEISYGWLQWARDITPPTELFTTKIVGPYIYRISESNPGDYYAQFQGTTATEIIANRTGEKRWYYDIDISGNTRKILKVAVGSGEVTPVLSPSLTLLEWAQYRMPGFTLKASKYFDAADRQAVEDQLRLEGVLETADGIATGMDTVIRFVPGSSLLLDLPEVLTGQSSTIGGKQIGGADRAINGVTMIGGTLVGMARIRHIIESSGSLVHGVRNAEGTLFKLGKHGEMPVPRLGEQSHHGAMSQWMKTHFDGYDPKKAPAVLMPDENHRATFGIYNSWRAETRQKMGGAFDWNKVTEKQVRVLSERMFDAAKVPTILRAQYWAEFEKMKKAIRRS